MVDRITIQKINNGYTSTKDYFGFSNNPNLTTHHPDICSLLEHLDGIYGEIERGTKKLKEEREQKRIPSQT